MPTFNKTTFEDDLKLLVWELRDNPYRKVLIALFLIWAVPFCVMFYLLFSIRHLDAQNFMVLFFAAIVAAGGCVMTLQVMKMILDKLVLFLVRAKHQDELKSKFVATVSHELKTPLMVLRTNFTNFYEGFVGSVTDDQKELLKVCREVIDRMDKMIREILDLYKIESGTIELRMERCDLRGILETQWNEIRPFFEQRLIKVSLNLPSADLSLQADREKLISVVNNFMTNALKYTTDKGEFSINVHAIQDFLQIEFTNTCEPIPDDRLEALFDKFEKLDMRQEGYGLGLSIARDIVENHKGKIWVEKKGQNKLCFVVCLRREAN